MTNTELLTNVERLTRAKEEVKRLEELEEETYINILINEGVIKWKLPM